MAVGHIEESEEWTVSAYLYIKVEFRVLGSGVSGWKGADWPRTVSARMVRIEKFPKSRFGF